jgi:hypothetical protein
MKKPLIITIDKTELHEYLQHGLNEENIILRDYVLWYLIDETIDYISETLKNQTQY